MALNSALKRASLSRTISPASRPAVTSVTEPTKP